MNDIKQQLLTEIKQRFGSFEHKDIKITDKRFPLQINNKHRKDKKLAKEKAKEEIEKGYHRGIIRKANLPTNYRFKPTAFNKGNLSYSGYNESGNHEYTIKSENGDVKINIDHKKSKRSSLKKGSLTTSNINIEFGTGKPSEETLNSIIPSIAHHINSHSPDTINFETKNLKAFYDKIIDGVSKKYRVSSNEDENGNYYWTLQSKSITPKIQHLIKSLLNK